MNMLLPSGTGMQQSTLANIYQVPLRYWGRIPGYAHSIQYTHSSGQYRAPMAVRRSRNADPGCLIFGEGCVPH